MLPWSGCIECAARPCHLHRRDRQAMQRIMPGCACLIFFLLLEGICSAQFDEDPLFESELIFPLEGWHNHASCIVETPRGDLLVCWFHGSGERKADDVKIEGARK